ncbi:MAG: hypothetical protein QM820_32470 [Minicystis sp.]
MMLLNLDRWFGFGVPYTRTGFATPFDAGHFAPLPRDFFERWANAHRAGYRPGSPTEGLLPRFDDLAWSGFDPGRVDPLIRRFYHQTSTFAVTITSVDWNGAWLEAGRLYRWAWADRVGNLMPPLDDGPVRREMDCHIGLLDADNDGVPDYRIWVRTFEDDDSLLYVAAVHSFRAGDRGYLTLAFPWPRFALTVVLECRNGRQDPASFEMHTNAPHSSLAGTYAVVPGGDRVSYARLPSLHETFRFAVKRGHGLPLIEGEHSAEVAGLRVFTMRYELAPTDELEKTSYRVEVDTRRGTKRIHAPDGRVWRSMHRPSAR